MPQRSRALPARAAGCGCESFYPIVQGYKDTPAIGVRVNFSDPLQLNRAHRRRRRLAGRRPAAERARAPRARDYQRYDWTAHAALERRRLLRPVRADQSRAARATTSGVGHTNTLIFDEPRRLTLDVDGSVAGNLDQLPEYQNVAV